jgi:UDP-N-acetyl-D-mannosaminuronic acid dehydrogenase
MKICVLGLGYIGLPTACLFANANHEVVGVDVNQATLKKLNQAKLPFEEKGIEDLLEKALPNMSFKRKPEEADVFFLETLGVLIDGETLKRLKKGEEELK